MLRLPTVVSLAAVVLLALAPMLAADDERPAGPIRERHDLMEEVGAHARRIGAAMKHGDAAAIADAAQQIEVASAKLLDLFPEGSRDRSSRALPSIWKQWDAFEMSNKVFGEAAAAVVIAAREDGDVGTAVRGLFQACKACHESFRTPQQ